MKNEIIVRKLIEYIEKIAGYVQNCDYETFSDNSMLAEACIFNLSQMGELVNHIDEDFEEAHPEIPWRYIYGLRKRIVHDYEGVN